MTKRQHRIAARKAAQRRRRLIGGIIAGIAVVGFALLAFRDRTPSNPSDEELAALEIAPRVGARAPDFTLANPEGQQVSLSDFRGKQVALNFMHTW